MCPVRCKMSLQSLRFYDTLIIFVYNNNNTDSRLLFLSLLLLITAGKQHSYIHEVLLFLVLLSGTLCHRPYVYRPLHSDSFRVD